MIAETIGGAYGIRTRGLRLERAVSLATRRMRLGLTYYHRHDFCL